MEVKATAKQVRVSPQKAQLVLALIRGKKVDEALALLRFVPTPTARLVAKVVRSAAANAENNFQMLPSNLRIVRTYADKGVTMKRMRAKARGRVNPILKRSSHITVVVGEKD